MFASSFVFSEFTLLVAKDKQSAGAVATSAPKEEISSPEGLVTLHKRHIRVMSRIVLRPTQNQNSVVTSMMPATGLLEASRGGEV